ncbi:MAG: penicillin-binding protein 2 [Acidobacteria bacterium]|nr:penicillin-binding protein 2 [Acidobacteriota bacterium]
MRDFPVENEQDKKLDAERILRDDTQFAASKIAGAQYVIFAVFLFLIYGFWDLQIQYREYYLEAADRNRIKSLPVLAPRGKILDRDGRVIVDNHASYSLMLSRETLKPSHLKPIAEGLDIDYEELQAKLARFDRTRPKYQPVVIKEELSPADLAFVESHRDSQTFPEMELVESHTRVYPKDGVAAHVAGYVGEISDAELNSDQFGRNKPGDVVGKAGIERHYNDLLTGEEGQRRVMVDNQGNERQVLGFKPAVPGKSLHLTIDLDLQIVAELALEGRRGAVVAIDPRNGEVLAMASRPSYDSNAMSGRLKAQQWKNLLTDPDKPLFNRTIQAQLAPGSTFKPIVAIAALETGSIDDDFGTSCSGGANWFGVYRHCHLKRGHGGTKLITAMAQSCDVFFYAVGNKTGIDNIAKYAEGAGLGSKTGIDLPYEASGTVPSTRWKIRTQREKWYVGETISVAIGQGALTVTPLQLAHATGGLAMGGVWHRPHLVVSRKDSAPARKMDLQPENVVKVVQGMYNVVNGGGTGGRSRLPGIELCGKTGTSQVVSLELQRANRGKREMADNAWFVGFAPRNNPEIVVATLFESGEHGDRAAPIVRDVVKAYFDKKALRERNAKALAMQQVIARPAIDLVADR